MYFPISEIEIAWYIPPLAGMILSFLTSMSGISGAFLLLPFQVEVLGYTAPSVSATNQFYNIVAIPSGVYRYAKEGRLHKPLARVLIYGAIPGVFLGGLVRIFLLTDPLLFKQFASLVLLYLAIRMLTDIIKSKDKKQTAPHDINTFKILEDNKNKCTFTFDNVTYSYSTKSIFWLSAGIALIGGVYGIGGGAIVAPLLVSFYKLPVYVTAGATLLCTFVSSIVGVSLFFVLSFIFPASALMPDFMLGALFGIGGLIGMNLGARCQKYMPAKLISMIIIFVLFITAFIWIKPLVWG